MPLLAASDIKSFLGIVGTGDDAALAVLALKVERAAARYCGRSAFDAFWHVTNARLVPNRTAVILPVRPISGRPLVTFGDKGFLFTASDISTGDDTITCEDHRLVTGDGPLRVYTLGTIAIGLSAATNYWAIRVDEDTVSLATTEALALAGTAVNITDAGAGTSRIIGPFEPAGAIEADPESGVVRLAGGGALPYGPLVVLYQSAVHPHSEDAILGALTEQAAYEWLRQGKGGRLGNSSTDKPAGVRDSYITTDWAPGVLAVLDLHRSRNLA